MSNSSKSLSRADVEAALTEQGACQSHQQVRALTRSDVDLLASLNAVRREAPRPTCEGLPLSGFAFVEGIDLSAMNFERAELRGCRLPHAKFDRSSLIHADLSNALLSHASFRSASLHDARVAGAWANNITLREAALYRADFSRADLRDADCHAVGAHDTRFAGATMWRAVFTKAELYGADFTEADCWAADFTAAALAGAQLTDTKLNSSVLRSTSFGNVRRETGTWVTARLDGADVHGAEWTTDFVCPEEVDSNYQAAAVVYRTLKDVHHRAGLYDRADQFAFREQAVARKQARVDRRWLSWAGRWTAELVFGYGYRPIRVSMTCVATFLVFTLLYWIGGLYGSHGLSELGRSAYFSAVSFSGVGYGPWVDNTPSALKYVGAIEAPCGITLLALLLVTASRRFLR